MITGKENRSSIDNNSIPSFEDCLFIHNAIQCPSLIRKKAHAKKTKSYKFKPISRLLGNTSFLKDELECNDFTILNKAILRDLKAMVNKKPNIDLSSITRQYVCYIRDILIHNGRKEEASNLLFENPSLLSNSTKTSFSLPEANLRSANSGENGNFRNNIFSNKSYSFSLPQRVEKSYSESYLAVCSLYGYNPLDDPEDSLTALLRQNYDPDEYRPTAFKYLRVEDIIKTKGVSIYGPRREDVGKYNRKIFDMKNNENVNANKIIVRTNPLFFEETRAIAADKNVINCTHLELEYYTNGIAVKLGFYMAVVFEESGALFCSIKNKEKYLFERIDQMDIETSYTQDTRNITLLYLPTFMIYNLIFNTCDDARFIYEKFFKTGSDFTFKFNFCP